MADSRKPAKTKPRPQDGRGGDRRGRQPDKGKLARGAAARRLEEKTRRQRTIVWSVVAVVALAALVGLIVWQGRGTPQAENKPVAADALAAARKEAGSSGLKTYPQAGRDHIPTSQQPRNWNSNPPTSGDHLGTPQQGGVYDTDQDMRALVHNLEHGYVLILYRNIPADQVDQLRQFVEARAGSKLILAPYSALDKDGVALVAWQNLETMQRLNMTVVQAFVNDYMVPGGSKSTAPEPRAA